MQSMVIRRHLASLAEDCFDASEGIWGLSGRPPGKRVDCGMRGFAAASFIPDPLAALTTVKRRQNLHSESNHRGLFGTQPIGPSVTAVKWWLHQDSAIAHLRGWKEQSLDR
jgi:hypothetical protein